MRVGEGEGWKVMGELRGWSEGAKGGVMGVSDGRGG